MRPARAGALALALALAAAGGCGPSGPEEAGGAHTVLTFRHGRVSGFEEEFSAVLREFERANPGVRVAEEIMPWDSSQQHQLYAINLEGGGASFDLMGLDIVWIAEFARAGWLADLEPWFDEEERARFLPPTIRAATVDAKPYGVPWFTDAGLLYYRRDLLEKHGLAVPRTWEELARASRAVLAAEGDPALMGFVWQGKQYEGLVCNALEYLASAGTSIVDERGRWALDEAKAQRALEFMAGLVESRVSPELVLAADEEASRRVFGDGRAVFLRNWPYALALFNRPDSAVSGKVGVAPLPSFAGSAPAGTLGGWHLAVNRRSAHPELAYRLAAYLTSPAVQRRLYESVGYLPTRSELYRDAALLRARPELASFARILETAMPRPVTPQYMSLSDVLQMEFSAVLAGIKSPSRAIQDIRTQVEPVLDAAAEREAP